MLVFVCAVAALAAVAQGAVSGYVQDGLIAHWDAIDNVGTGVHDASATTWKDLTGLHPDMVFPNGTLIGDNYYDMAGVSGGTGGYVTNIADIATAIMNKACTVEIVCDFRSQVENGTLFACYESTASKRILWARSNNGGATAAACGCFGSADYRSTASMENTWYKLDNGRFNEPRIYTVGCNGDTAKIYRNGVDTSLLIAGSSIMGVDVTKAWFCIGRRYAETSPSPGVADMKVYAVRIYDRVLAPAEILANAHTDDMRFGLHVVFPSPKSSRDYVQNGLVAQWDGVENAGRGVHKDNARTWKDLVGSSDFIFPNGANVGATFFDMMHTNGTSAAGYATNVAAAATAIGIDHCATVEVVCDFRSMANDGTLIGFLDGSASRRLLWVRSADYDNIYVHGCASVCEYMRSQWDPNVNLELDVGVFNAVRTYQFVCQSSVCAVSKNGTFVKNISKGAVTIDAAGATNTWLSIGLGRASSGTQANNADVKIHAIRIYNRQLSEEEIASNAEVDDWRFSSGQYVETRQSGFAVYVH